MANETTTKKKREIKDGETAARARGAMKAAKDLKESLTVMAGDERPEIAEGYKKMLGLLAEIGAGLAERNASYLTDF